jgi:hypothetical protein
MHERQFDASVGVIVPDDVQPRCGGDDKPGFFLAFTDRRLLRRFVRFELPAGKLMKAGERGV